MTSEPKVYIAGVGFSPLPARGSPAKSVITSLVSAATKALLDAGVTYDDVSRGVTSVKDKTSTYGAEAFKAFGEDGVTVDEEKSGFEFDNSFHCVRDRVALCVLMIAVAKVCLSVVSNCFRDNIDVG